MGREPPKDTKGNGPARWLGPVDGGDEVVHLLLGLVLLVPIPLLELAQELVLLAADERPVVVGQLAPLRLELAGQLLPAAFDLVPIHRLAPVLGGPRLSRQTPWYGWVAAAARPW